MVQEGELEPWKCHGHWQSKSSISFVHTSRFFNYWCITTDTTFNFSLLMLISCFWKRTTIHNITMISSMLKPHQMMSWIHWITQPKAWRFTTSRNSGALGSGWNLDPATWQEEGGECMPWPIKKMAWTFSHHAWKPEGHQICSASTRNANWLF